MPAIVLHDGRDSRLGQLRWQHPAWCGRQQQSLERSPRVAAPIEHARGGGVRDYASVSQPLITARTAQRAPAIPEWRRRRRR